MTPQMTKSAARYVKYFTETIGTMRASVDRHDTLEPVQPIEHDEEFGIGPTRDSVFLEQAGSSGQPVARAWYQWPDRPVPCPPRQ